MDIQKAFDLVYRNGIWFKILNMGGSCKIVEMVQAIYSSVKSCVRTNTSNNINSAYFNSLMGVKHVYLHKRRFI